MFQFMFMDAWPAITWSVVSHKRVPKKGYFTLQQAYQPILAGGDFRGDHWSVKQQFGGGDDFVAFSPWVINDYQRSFENCQLTVSLRGKDNGYERILGEQLFTLPNDSLITLDTVRFKYFGEVDPGNYEIIFKVEHEGSQVSLNQYEIVID
ncbi:hypothetical protein [Neobacillus jeddahensis]|uniref:hypothetical protein n=1 Tax=Neobacillus jeddahensis TaxID=1461580 RepID=UPI000590C033|nr:hypothetical protein [Neobacillus jeddahensis]